MGPKPRELQLMGSQPGVRLCIDQRISITLFESLGIDFFEALFTRGIGGGLGL